MTSTEYKQTISRVKEEQKTLAAEIREGRKDKKTKWRVRGISEVYRFRHLAYCLVRGRSLREIEHKNDPSKALYRTDILAYMKQLFGQEIYEYCRPYVTAESSAQPNKLSNSDDLRIPRPPREEKDEAVCSRAS